MDRGVWLGRKSQTQLSNLTTTTLLHGHLTRKAYIGKKKEQDSKKNKVQENQSRLVFSNKQTFWIQNYSPFCDEAT